VVKGRERRKEAMKKIAALVLMILISTGVGRAAETTVSLEGGQFGPESRNCVKDDKRITGGAKLYGSFGYGTAVYEFQVSGKAENLGAEADFINPKKKRLSIYLFNFGSAKDANPARAKKLDPKWWLWGDSQEDNWVTPANQAASDGTGEVAFVSPQGKVRMLLHAPGGIPYLSDGLFFISRVGLKVGTTEAELTGFQTSEDAWMEGGVVLAKGIGKPPQGVNPARGRILALRAAKAVAMRNLLLSMGEVRREDGTLYVQGTLVGVKVREEKTLPDGSVEVVVEMPVE
jgi:hypothetical protein